MKTGRSIEIGLNAAIIAIEDGNPIFLCFDPEENADSKSSALPYGPFDPDEHRTMKAGLRKFVDAQMALKLGYIEQLYTFGDVGRHQSDDETNAHIVSVAYLALTKRVIDSETPPHSTGSQWKNIYQFLPWEDWRKGKPAMLDEILIPKMIDWMEMRGNRSIEAGLQTLDQSRRSRVRIAFGLDGVQWDEERALERYELIYSAGLVDEAMQDKQVEELKTDQQLGLPMLYDHRRILATALSRLRSKIKYRPVVFELMPDEFTLLMLQKTVESIMGKKVHKQNFRRLVEQNKLVEATGKTSLSTGGRPAAMFKFRREVIAERPAPGLRLGRS